MTTDERKPSERRDAKCASGTVKVEMHAHDRGKGGSLAVRLVSWNIAGSKAPWYHLADMDCDVGLLQEAGQPPQDLPRPIDVDPEPWRTAGLEGWPRRAAVARLSDRVDVEWIPPKSTNEADPGEFAVSRPGTVSAAHVSGPGVESFVAVSMYAIWESPHSSTGSGWIVADAAAHRIISDLSMFIGRQNGHRILAAGDLNILLGYGLGGSRYWAGRHSTVFDRMEALGLSFVGPQDPDGRQADPWPDDLPSGSRNVPTFHMKGKSPATAAHQLDFVFASRDMADSVHVRALNDPDHWGPSDHCRIEIVVS